MNKIPFGVASTQAPVAARPHRTLCSRCLSAAVCCTPYPSNPFTLSLHARAYKGHPPPTRAFHPRQRLLSASGKSPPHHVTSISATPSVPSHLTRFPSSSAGQGASPELGVAPRATRPPPSQSLSSSTVDHASELRISVARPPHCKLMLSTMSGKCTVVHGRRPCSPSYQPSSCRPPPPAPRCVPCTSCGRQCGPSMPCASDHAGPGGTL
jgi:hypothetical protein